MFLPSCLRVRPRRMASCLGWSVPACLLATALCSPAAAEPWKRHVIDASSRGADGIRLMEVNGDRFLDLVTGWEEGGLIRVYLNPGPQKAGESWPAVTVGQVKSPEDAVFADLDNDGSADVVSATEGGNRTVYIHWAPPDREQYRNPEAWKTQAIAATQGKEMWMFTLPMQIDGRDGIDLIVGSKGDGGSISWLQAPANPRDVSGWKLHRLYDAGWIMSLIAADMDFDGDMDVLASDRKGDRSGVLWLENPGPAAAASGQKWKEHRVGPLGREVMFIDIADVEGDGRFDILAPVKPGEITWFKLTREGNWLTQTIPVTGNVGNVKSAQTADLNNDGKLDIVVSFEGAEGDKSGVVWLERQRRIWRMHDVSGAAGVKFDLVVPMDLDNDGDLDLITCEEREGLGLIWYENPQR